MERDIVAIYARASNGVIGREGRLPWHIPADLRRFKTLTMGTPMIMGRKTFESLGRPLPGRRHIVLTRRERWDSEGAELARSVEQALAMAREDEAARHISVIGGAAVYDALLPQCNRVETTEIHAEYDGDVFMNPLGALWEVTARQDYEAEGEHPAYSFVSYRRLAGAAP